MSDHVGAYSYSDRFGALLSGTCKNEKRKALKLISLVKTLDSHLTSEGKHSSGCQRADAADVDLRPSAHGKAARTSQPRSQLRNSQISLRSFPACKQPLVSRHSSSKDRRRLTLLRSSIACFFKLQFARGMLRRIEFPLFLPLPSPLLTTRSITPRLELCEALHHSGWSQVRSPAPCRLR